MHNIEHAVDEALHFLDYRKKIMDNPYIVVGKEIADKLAEYHNSIGVSFSIELLEETNYKFTLTSA